MNELPATETMHSDAAPFPAYKPYLCADIGTISYVDSSTYSLSGIEPVTRSSLSDSDSLTARARGPFLPSDRQLSLLRLLALALLWHSL